MSERGHAVCNLERGVKIAVGDSDGRIAERTNERAASEWSLGDKSRRRYNVGSLITDPQAEQHALLEDFLRWETVMIFKTLLTFDS